MRARVCLVQASGPSGGDCPSVSISCIRCLLSCYYELIVIAQQALDCLYISLHLSSVYIGPFLRTSFSGSYMIITYVENYVRIILSSIHDVSIHKVTDSQSKIDPYS